MDDGRSEVETKGPGPGWKDLASLVTEVRSVYSVNSIGNDNRGDLCVLIFVRDNTDTRYNRELRLDLPWCMTVGGAWLFPNRWHNQVTQTKLAQGLSLDVSMRAYFDKDSFFAYFSFVRCSRCSG